MNWKHITGRRCGMMIAAGAIAMVGCTVQPPPSQPAYVQPAPQPQPYPQPAEPAPQPAPPVAEPAPPEPQPMPPQPAPYPEPAPPVAPAPPPGQPGVQHSGPITCGNGQSLRLINYRIEARGTALTIRGNCKVLLTDSEIIAGDYGIRIQGRGRLTIRRTNVHGARGAVWMGGSTLMNAKQSIFDGRFHRGAGAMYEDRGGNEWRGAAVPPPTRPRPFPPQPQPPEVLQPAPPNPARLRRARAYKCKNNRVLRLNKLHIETRDNGVFVQGNCRVIITDSYIIAGRYGLRITGRGTVTARRSHIQGAMGAVKMSGSSVLEARRSLFLGGLLRSGSADYRDNGGNAWENGGVVPPRPAPPRPMPPQPEPPAPMPPPATRGPIVPARGDLRPGQPINCSGTERIRVANLRIESRGHALVVRGSCNVVVADSHIISTDGWAIRVLGTGTVTVRRSRVQGARGAVQLMNAATLSARHSLFIGSLDRRGSATDKNDGQNSWRERGQGRPVPPPAPAPEPAPAPVPPPPVTGQLKPSGPIECRGQQNLRLERLRIETPRNGLTVRGNCSVLIVDSHIIAGNVGIRVQGRGTVTVRRSKVRGNNGAVRIDGRATVTARKTVFRGGMKRQGQATFRDNGGNQWR